MMFQPSEFSYGEAEIVEEVETEPAAGAEQYLQYVPFLRGVLGLDDPEEEAAVIEAKIENLKRTRDSLPPFSHGLYNNQINKLEAKLVVLSEQAAAAKTQNQLKQVATVVVVGTLLVGGVWALGKAVGTWKEALE